MTAVDILAAEYDLEQAHRNHAHERELFDKFTIGVSNIKELNINADWNQNLPKEVISRRKIMISNLDPKEVWRFFPDGRMHIIRNGKQLKFSYLYVRGPKSLYSILQVVDDVGRITYWNYDSGNSGTTFRPVKYLNGIFVADDSRLMLFFSSDSKYRQNSEK